MNYLNQSRVKLKIIIIFCKIYFDLNFIYSFFCYSHEESRSIETTSISPIPRPVSSINMATLIAQSSFPVCISPPPSPSCPQVSSLGGSQPSSISLSPVKLSGVYVQTLAGQLRSEPPSLDTAAPLNDQNSQCEEAEVATTVLKRAVSCDSICSDTSVALGDLEMFNVTGYLCVGLEYDR